MPYNKKVLLICGSSQTVVNFRFGLIGKLKQKGYDIGVVAFDEDRKEDIENLGIEFHCVNDKNRALNPLKILTLKKRYLSIIKKVRPDIVFTFMLKPNIFGVRAAKKAGVKIIFSMVEGVGDVFVNSGIKWKFIRFVVCKMYKRSFRYAQKIFFLNKDDKAEFVSRGLVKNVQCDLIPGIGVDLVKFASKPLTEHNVFLMIARMLKNKGVMEYCRVARIVKQSHPDVEFGYLGAEGNIRIADIQEYIDDGSINYLGTTRDVRAYLERSTFLLLPSYREGLPMAIMEAEAIGRGIITSDNVGCRDTVIDGYNGFLIKQGDYKAMAEKCMYILEHPEEADRMGQNSRRFAEEHFDQETINEQIIGMVSKYNV